MFFGILVDKRERERESQTDRQTETDRLRQTDRDRQTVTDRLRMTPWVPVFFGGLPEILFFM